MTAIGKGDFVVCVDDSDDGHMPSGLAAARRFCAGEAPEIGRLYEVERAWVAVVFGFEVPVLQLCGLRRPQDAVETWGGHAFAASRFRPVSKGERGMFDHLLKAPTDAPSKEPVAA